MDDYDYEIKAKNFELKIKKTPEAFEHLARFIMTINPQPKRRGRPPRSPFALPKSKPKRAYHKTGKYSKKAPVELPTPSAPQ